MKSSSLTQPSGQYVTNQATRIIVKAVGELDTSVPASGQSGATDSELEVEEISIADPQLGQPVLQEESPYIDYESYKPTIIENEWILSETDLCTFSL